PVDVYLYETTVMRANTSTPKLLGPVNAAGRKIHANSTVCQGGTTCVATGQDRRLGDFFTNTINPRGCVLIASGDDMLSDPLTGGPLPTSRPIFIRQKAGPALIGTQTC